MRHLFLVGCLAVCFLVIAISCSDDKAVDSGNSQQNPLGTLLPGDPSDLAIDALYDLTPTPVPESDITSEGLLTTRLDAFLLSTATVGEVNSTLESSVARIISMDAGHSGLTLIVEKNISVDALESLADSIASSGAFIAVFPTYRPELLSPSFLPSVDTDSLEHFLPIKMPAAWNAVEQARSENKKITAIVSDLFYSHNKHSEISVQRFAGAGNADATTVDPSGVMYIGNHGFHVAGIIGANWDAIGSTGISPDPSKLLELVCLSLSGLSMSEMIRDIVNAFPATGKFVVNTSWSYGDFVKYSKVKRAFYAMQYRELIEGDKDRFVHATAAGNNGLLAGDDADAKLNSPFTAAKSFEDLRDVTNGDATATAQQLYQLESSWLQLIAAKPGASSKSDNVMIVGNSGPAGIEHPTSSQPSELRAVGESVRSTCVQTDPNPGVANENCDGIKALYGGTSMSSPQVAGLAAYMMNLDPSEPAGDVIEKIQQSFDNSTVTGLIDAYYSVLALDASMGSADVRDAILDVSGSDGLFTQADISVFLAQFEAFEAARQGNPFPDRDYSRFDLNGDGFTGGSSTDRFDLDVNYPPAFTGVQQLEGNTLSFLDENNLSDEEILCFYAFSPLYDGDDAQRDQLLPDCAGEVRTPGYVDVRVSRHIYSNTFNMSNVGSCTNMPRPSDTLNCSGSTKDSADGLNGSKEGSLNESCGLVSVSGSASTSGTVQASSGSLVSRIDVNGSASITLTVSEEGGVNASLGAASIYRFEVMNAGVDFEISGTSGFLFREMNSLNGGFIRNVVVYSGDGNFNEVGNLSPGIYFLDVLATAGGTVQGCSAANDEVAATVELHLEFFAM